MSTASLAATDAAGRFLSALERRDYEALGNIFQADARLRGLVPSNLRDEHGRDAIAARFEFWNDGDDWKLVASDVTGLEDLVRIRWRVRCTDPDDGAVVYEQTAYASADERGIAWMNLVCSGRRAQS